jgi:hypothetical protein
MINIDDYIITKDFYQIQLNHDKVCVKCVAHGDKIGDVLIKKDFGHENKYSLYSCIYEKEEITIDRILPVIYLTDGIRKYYISVLLKNITLNIEHTDFDLLFSHGYTKQHFFSIEKNIDKNNIIQQLFTILANRNIKIIQ